MRDTDDLEDRKRALRSASPTLVPGVTDALQARLAARAGFEFIYVSGAGTAAALGYPDMGVIDLGELVSTTRLLTDASGLPAVVDFDAGYGNLHAVRRGARDLYRAGAIGLQIEDQPMDRRCGYLEPEASVSVREMNSRLEAAREGAPQALLIARTDTLLAEGLEEALRRANAYSELADMVMINGIQNVDQLRRLRTSLETPMVYNVSGSDRSPYLSRHEASTFGISVLLYPIQVPRAAVHAAASYLTGLAAGSIGDVELLGFSEYMDLAGWAEAADFESRFRPE